MIFRLISQFLQIEYFRVNFLPKREEEHEGIIDLILRRISYLRNDDRWNNETYNHDVIAFILVEWRHKVHLGWVTSYCSSMMQVPETGLRPFIINFRDEISCPSQGSNCSCEVSDFHTKLPFNMKNWFILTNMGTASMMFCIVVVKRPITPRLVLVWCALHKI